MPISIAKLPKYKIHWHNDGNDLVALGERLEKRACLYSEIHKSPRTLKEYGTI